MGDIKLTFGKTNQSISADEMKEDLYKSKFKSEVQQSIFNIFDTNKDKKLGFVDKSIILKMLEKAAAADGDASNLSEQEALKFLEDNGIKNAKAQDLFDFFNITLGRSTEQNPVEKLDATPPVQESITPEEEPLTPENDKQEMIKPRRQNAFQYSANPNVPFIEQDPQNPFFSRALDYRAAMDLNQNGEKDSLLRGALTYENKAKIVQQNPVKDIIKPVGANSVSVGTWAQYNQEEGLSLGASALGQFATGSQGRMSFAVTDTKSTDANWLGAKVTEQIIIGPVDLTMSGSVQDYTGPIVDMTKFEANASVSTPLPTVKDSKVFLGGNIKAEGNLSKSTTTVNSDENLQGSSTILRGTVGVEYTFGIPVGGKIGTIPLMVSSNISAFNMDNSEEGVKLAGDVGGMVSILPTPTAQFGSVPFGGSFRNRTGASIPELSLNELINKILDRNYMDQLPESVKLTANIRYVDDDLFGINKNAQHERYLQTGLNAELGEYDINTGVRYTLTQVAGQTPNHEIIAYGSKEFNLGGNVKGKVTASGGWNSEQGATFGAGVSFGVLPKKK